MKCALLVLALVPLIAAAPAVDPEQIIDALMENRHGEHHSRSGCTTVVFAFNLDDDRHHGGHHGGDHGHGGHGGHHGGDHDKEYIVYRPENHEHNGGHNGGHHGGHHGGHNGGHNGVHGHDHSSSSSESHEHHHQHKRPGGYRDDLVKDEQVEKDAQAERDANEVM